MVWSRNGARSQRRPPSSTSPARGTGAKAVLLAGALAIAAAGCASQNLEGRRTERAAAYAALPEATRTAVDAGEVQVGMPMDAVYIAWGKPARVMRAHTAAGGVEVTWIYRGVQARPYRYWRAEPGWSGHSYVSQYELAHGWQPEYYVRAEVIFENDRVKAVRTFARP